jgi:hypothetical protein
MRRRKKALLAMGGRNGCTQRERERERERDVPLLREPARRLIESFMHG